jgi:hypothetical protein
MSVAATRMYRSLTDFISSIDKYEFLSFILRARSSSCRHSAHTSDDLPRSDRTGPSTKFSSIAPTGTAPSRMEMDVHIPYDPDHYLIPQPSRYVSFVDLSRQECGPLRGPSFDEDPESARENDRMVRPLPITY